MIFFEAPPPMSVEEFMSSAQEVLSGGELKPLEELVNNTPSSHPFVVAWRNYDTQLRNAIARARATRLGVDSAAYLRAPAESDFWAERKIAMVFEESDPLKREDVIERLRFEKARELAGLEPLTLNTLLAYLVQLQIVSRRALRDTERGHERRDKLTTI